MAEALAGLLTSAVVAIAKDKLASTIREQANLLWNFGDDLEDMMTTLEYISAALQDAEKRSAKEKLVQLWLKRLKHAAIDISGMLEDYTNAADQLTEKVPRMLSCLPIAREKIALANRMKSMRGELMKINKEFQSFNFIQGCTSTSIREQSDVRETLSRLPEKTIVGRNGEKQEIIDLLLSASASNNKTVIVAIYGLGGMGKSTLAQLIYNDAHFKNYDHRIWVYVSRDFSLRKIGNSIISLLSTEAGQNSKETLEMINHCLDNLFLGKKVLIVLDDLWEDKDTELGKLRSMLHVGKKGSMIDVIVTTRKEGIARNVSTSRPYKLQPLKDDTCWEIIKRYSEFDNKHNQERLEQIGLDIAKKCGGVALAAQALGCMLKSKDLSGWTEINNSDAWNEFSEDEGGVLPSLKLSYERMQPQLRICFSYCAIFPKGHNISEDELIHQWIALGFIKPSLGKEYIRKLLGMSFLQASKLEEISKQHTERYTMHDLVHDLATLTIGDEFVSDIASKNNNRHVQKYCFYSLVTKYDKATSLSKILPSTVRALHFSDNGKLDLSSGAFSFAKCLCILDFSGCSSIQLPASIGKLKQLKYLLAPRMQNEVLPKYITERAKLQYLNLNGSSRISTLPESIGKLAGCIKYLGLSGCSGISKLPESFGDLIFLMMHLDMSGCSQIRKLPDSLGNLTNLQHLELSQCSSLRAIPESLCSLTQLQYLNLSSCKYIGRLPEAIGCLIDLQYLNFSGCSVRELPESFKRLGSLLHLDLKFTPIEKGLPGALRGLTTLEYLNMSDLYIAQNLEKDEMSDAMKNLTNLKVLNLAFSLDYFDVKNDDGYLDFIGTLTNLESLDLSRNISSDMYIPLPENIGNLKRLHTLNLMYCESLKSLPEGIRGATGLKSVLLEGCSDELIERASSLLPYSLTLPLFKVCTDDVNSHSNLHQLEGENDAIELDIVSLENVRSLEEAQRLKLSTKQNLLNLTLSWTQDANRLIEDKDLLGELVPPMSLKYFGLRRYSSPSFPSWIMDISHHLPNLTWIELSGLPNCSNLPPLGQLPCLEKLSFNSLQNVTKVDSGICGGKGAFPRLKELAIFNMVGLEEWNTTYPGEGGVEESMFHVVELIKISHCPRMWFKPHLPKCQEFYIVRSDQVISSLEEVKTSGHHCNPTPATRLTIEGIYCNSFRVFHHFPALQKLQFYHCPNLTCLPNDIKQLSSLQSLVLLTCDGISALPEWLSDISLKELHFRGCRAINSLPQCIQQLTSLQKLVIGWNRELPQWCESEENKAKVAHISDIIYEEDY